MSETKGTSSWADAQAALDIISGAQTAEKSAQTAETRTPAPGLRGDVDLGDDDSVELSEDEPEDLDTKDVVLGKDPAIMEYMGSAAPESGVAPNPFLAPEGTQGRLIRKGISEREVELIGNLVYDRICQEIGIKRGVKLQSYIDSNMDAIGTTMAQEDEELGRRIGVIEQRVTASEVEQFKGAETRVLVDAIRDDDLPQMEARVLSCETKVAELAAQLADNLTTIKEATEQMTAALVKYAPMKADDEDDAKSLPSTVTKAKHALVDIGSRLEAVAPIASSSPQTSYAKKAKSFNY